jgi:hypothetical protein
MNRKRVKLLLKFSLILAAQTSGSMCLAQTASTSSGVPAPSAPITDPGDNSSASAQAKKKVPDNSRNTSPDNSPDTNTNPDSAATDANPLGVEFFKHLIADQKAIVTSPARLRWSDGSWLFPLAAATGGFLASDRAVTPALTTDQHKLNRYVKVSDYGLYSMVGVGGGLYLLGKMTHDDHKRETGVLAGEAAIDALGDTTALKYIFARQRPYQGNGLGNFFDGGTSFPSDHSAVTWSIASVIAHEYPGPLTQVAVYGLATAVSGARVLGKQHFPSDVVVGAAIGWLIGRQVYRAHHDPDLGGDAVGRLGAPDEGEDHRERQHMGSPLVALDSWVYPAFERLAALQYLHTELLGLKPWTRIECARLTAEAGETLTDEPGSSIEEAARLQKQLEQEFSYEIALLDGGHNLTANLESLYARGVSISGPALTDSYHFGQTIAYDYGRPFERGTNGQAGGSFSAAAGPLMLYVRAEYQHAPGAPAPSPAAVNAIAVADAVSSTQVSSGPVAPVNRLELLDSYVGVNLGNWQLTLGKQSLSWTPAPEGSLEWSDNIDPIKMARIMNPEPLHLPPFLEFLGPVRTDQFFGRLEGHPYVARPFIYGQKINVKPFRFLELGFSRTVTLGGQGSGNPLTGGDLWRSFVGKVYAPINSVPGHNQSEMDWTFYVPGVHNYFIIYGDATAPDDILPIENPARNPWHPGIYITRFPGLPKLDFHIEGVSTEQPGLAGLPGFGGGPANKGEFNYWNQSYRDGYTNAGNIIGNAVGRDGRSIRAWFTYSFSPRNSLQARYQHNSVAAEFIPGGGAWQDYSVSNQTYLQSGFYVKVDVQYEHISRYPLLFNGPQRNVTAILEVGFSPRERGQK